MSREILIQTQKGERLVAIVDRGRVDDFHIEVDRYQSLLGNIYKGRVESILPSINAAFVNIGQERNGFLYLTDAANPLLEEEKAPEKPTKILDKIFKRKEEEVKPKKTQRKPRHKKDEIPLKVGQEILVQVVKDPFGEKGCRLTTHITLPGRFVVYMPRDKKSGISRKIEKPEERRRLREVMQEFAFAKQGGYIVRTASMQQSKTDLVRDAKVLYTNWLKIGKLSAQEKAPALIYEEGQLTWKIVRDYLTDRIDKVVIDSKEDYDKIKKFVQTLIGKEMVSKIHHYKGRKTLFDTKGISKDLQSIYETNVYVKTGAYVVIEPTEGVCVIDVNSGKFKVKASPGEAAFMVNMEVVPEIARQLRLRDLGGIIVIDFIDMTQEIHKRKVVDALRRALTRDHAKTEVYRISPLGLVEMTRARTGKTVESISFKKCTYCEGRGRIKLA
ncbi:MAG: ribonuclease G [Candidatus Omnitrophota bacterium]